MGRRAREVERWRRIITFAMVASSSKCDARANLHAGGGRPHFACFRPPPTVETSIFRPSAVATCAATSCGAVVDPEATDWHMHRDACDEWLDGALINRCSIFTMASSVVEYYLSSDSPIGAPLRRANPEGLGDVDVDGASNPRRLERMFEPLFGPVAVGHFEGCNDDDDAPPSRGRDVASFEDEEDRAPPASRTIKPAIKRTPKKNRRRTNLKITVAYRGPDFCGWEDQRHELYRTRSEGISQNEITPESSSEHTLPSVQGTLVDVLDPILRSKADDDCHCNSRGDFDGNSRGDSGEACSGSLREKRVNKKLARSKRTNNKPIEIKVAGRTDRGVSAVGQVCRVRTWRRIDGVEAFVESFVNGEMERGDGGLRITKVERVGDDFHPSFGASRRSYAYLVDLDEDEDERAAKERGGVDVLVGPGGPRISPRLVPGLDRMLRALEEKELDYVAFSHGKVKTQTTLCTLYRARAGIVEWAGGDDPSTTERGADRRRRAICFEIAGNRFLRRMVRILVATALREARRDGDGGEDALLKILETKDRKLRSRAAPPDGLLFVGAEF